VGKRSHRVEPPEKIFFTISGALTVLRKEEGCDLGENQPEWLRLWHREQRGKGRERSHTSAGRGQN
jgi:hypothetical protein